MTTVTVYKPTQTSERHDFTYSHNAKSWLLLSGYLPTEENDHRYIQPYTGCTAILETFK